MALPLPVDRTLAEHTANLVNPESHPLKNQQGNKLNINYSLLLQYIFPVRGNFFYTLSFIEIFPVSHLIRFLAISLNFILGVQETCLLLYGNCVYENGRMEL